MPDLGPHAFYILAAYAATALVLAGLVIRVVWLHRTARAQLAALDAVQAGDEETRA